MSRVRISSPAPEQSISETHIHESQFQNVSVCSISRKARILTGGIHGVFRGLKFEPDAEIGQNGTFWNWLMRDIAHVAQSVERFLGKEEVHRFDSGRGLHG